MTTAEKIKKYKEELLQIGITGEVASVVLKNGRRKIAVEVNCVMCGRAFYKPAPEVLKRPQQKNCCSIECRQKLQKESVTGANSKRWKGGLVTRNCVICGTTFQRKPDQVRTRNSVFCSRKCFGVWKSRTWVKGNHHNWKGGYRYKYGAEAYHGGWSRIREAIKERDGRKCALCQATNTRLHVHHKVPLRMFDTPSQANVPDNLITLCTKCHSKEEAKLKKLFIATKNNKMEILACP